MASVSGGRRLTLVLSEYRRTKDRLRGTPRPNPNHACSFGLPTCRGCRRKKDYEDLHLTVKALGCEARALGATVEDLAFNHDSGAALVSGGLPTLGKRR